MSIAEKCNHAQPVAERMVVLLDIDRLIGSDLVGLGASGEQAA